MARNQLWYAFKDLHSMCDKKSSLINEITDTITHCDYP